MPNTMQGTLQGAMQGAMQGMQNTMQGMQNSIQNSMQGNMQNNNMQGNAMQRGGIQNMQGPRPQNPGNMMNQNQPGMNQNQPGMGQQNRMPMQPGQPRGQMPNQQNQQQRKLRYFLALFDYDPITMSPNPDSCEEELPFREGDTIKVKKELLSR